MLFITDAPPVVIAVIVFVPDVNVVPLYETEYPVEALVAKVILDVPVPVAPIDSVPNATVAAANVNVNVSSTFAVTVICPAVDVATSPVSIGVVQAASENVVIRIKKVELVALGLVTDAKFAVMPAVGAPVLLAFNIRNSPAVAVLTVQDPPDPKLEDEAKVEVLALNPGASVQAPDAVVQAAKLTDLIVVA